jgi:hypothetical protein
MRDNVRTNQYDQVIMGHQMNDLIMDYYALEYALVYAFDILMPLYYTRAVHNNGTISHGYGDNDCRLFALKRTTRNKRKEIRQRIVHTPSRGTS